MERYHYLFFFFPRESRLPIHPSGKSGVYKDFTFKVNEITLYLLAAVKDAHCILHLIFFSLLHFHIITSSIMSPRQTNFLHGNVKQHVCSKIFPSMSVTYKGSLNSLPCHLLTEKGKGKCSFPLKLNSLSTISFAHWIYS